MASVVSVADPTTTQNTATDAVDRTSLTGKDVVFTSERGFASVALVEGVAQATPEQVFDSLTREDLPPSLRFVKERTQYKLVRSDASKGIKLYDAQYKANYRVAGGYTWQGDVRFQIEQDRAGNMVTMKLANPGFLQRLEISFTLREVTSGLTAITVRQALKPAIPTWDPVSKQIVKSINKGLLLDTLTDTIQHVDKVKEIPLPHHEPAASRTPSRQLSLPSGFNLPHLPSLGSKLALPWPVLDRQDSTVAA